MEEESKRTSNMSACSWKCLLCAGFALPINLPFIKAQRFSYFYPLILFPCHCQE